MITIYFGKAAAGKDTFFQNFIKNFDVKPIISDTTRTKRAGEVNGREYNFISDEEYDIRKDAGLYFEEYHSIRDGKHVRYAAPSVDATQAWAVVLAIEGTKQYIQKYGRENVAIIEITADDEVRHQRYLARGGTEEDWQQRKILEDKEFSDEEIEKLLELYKRPISVVNNTGDKPLMSVRSPKH